MNCIAQCVARCYFRKGNGEGFHYHPLALEVLGRQLGCRGENPSEWVHNLGVSSKETVVFDVLRTSFDLLDAREQALFMDVGFFFNPVPSYARFYDRKGGLLGFRDELLALYKGNEGDLQNRLDNLRRKGLLQAADLSSGRISMHDLYREFAELEAKGKFGDGADMASRKWVYVGLDWGGDLSELEITPAGGCWSKLTRLWIRDYWYPRPDHVECITSLEGIEWHHFPNVSMLHIHGLNHVLGTLNLKGMKQLRFLRLNGLDSLRRIEDLSVLTNLSYLECTIRFVFMATCSVGQFPASLKYLSIAGPSVFLSRNAVARCVKLCKLVLDEVRAGGEQLDLTNCSSLESVTLRYLGDVQIVLLPTAKGAPKLRILKIRSRFANVVHVQGLEQSVGLEQLYLDGWCRSKEVPCLLALTRLQILRIDEVGTHFELRIPRQIQELYLKRSGFIEAPRLHGFEQLQVLHFSGSEDLTGMSGMGDLPALRRLRLFNCRRLQQLPDLRKSSNLEQLDLEGCSELKLLEDDIQMLAALPSLHPVVFSPSACIRRFRVDLVRRKVLQHPGKQGPKSWLGWKEGEWAEHELGLPPVGIVTELEEWRALSADPDVVENDGTVESFFLDLIHRFDQ